MNPWVRSVAAVWIVLAAGMSGGCATYTAPGRGADLAPEALQNLRAQQSDVRMEQLLALRPLAQFPVSIAVVRVQSPGYRSYTVANSYGTGAYSVVTQRDVEKDEDFERLAKLPMIRGIAPVNRLMIDPELKTDIPLREAAARLGADMVLMYTLDTTLTEEDNARVLSVVSLGLSPNKLVRVSCTASALLIDTRNGYIYGAAEATESTKQLTNAWQNSEAADQSRRRAESAAFKSLTGEIEKLWKNVVETYAKPATSSR